MQGEARLTPDKLNELNLVGIAPTLASFVGTEIGSEQAFLEGVGLTTLDSDKRLHCLS